MAVPNAPEFGCTDETYGYVQRYRKSQVPRKVETKAGNGDTKYLDWVDNKIRVEGTYMFIQDSGTDADPISQVGSGTTITLSESRISGDIYIDEAHEIFTGGDNPQALAVEFVGFIYPNLAS